jgi:DNA repair protein SbcC/Rad50
VIPLRLHLTNFLSYGEMAEPIDFSNVHLACLSGPNGHGKSALLDAITWALWGKARGSEGGHDQERLIRDGTDATSVEFVFELEGQTYRVARTRWRNGKGDIAFNVQAPDGAWTDMAGEGKKDTQSRITERLRMDYETFVTSAFILQGRSDTFTTMEPSKRKDVLAKILGLEVYERLTERARELKKDAQADADAHSRMVERLEGDLAERDDLERRKAEAAVSLAAAETARTEADAALAELQGKVAELQGVEAAAAEAQKRHDHAKTSLEHEDAEIARLTTHAEELERAATVDDALRDRAGTRPALEKQEAKLEEARSRHDELTAEAASLDARLGEERSRLDAERASHERAVSRLTKDLEKEDQARELLELAQAEIASLDEAAAERETLLVRRAEIRERQGGMEAERQARETERAETEEKLSLLDEKGAGCPLCGQELTPAHRKEVKASFNARLKELLAADRDGAKEAKTLAAELKDVDARGTALKKSLEQRETMAGQAAALGQQLEHLGAARKELDTARRAAEEIAARLTAGDFAAPEGEKLARVKEELAAVGFEPKAYRELKAALEAARSAERGIADAKHAASELASCRREAKAATERAARAKGALAEAAAALEAMGEKLGALPGFLEQRSSAEGARSKAQAAVDEAGRTLAGCDRALEVLDRQAEAAKEAKAARAAAKKTAALYEKLAKAFGRDGIPARIIGNAIPELRIEANRLLNMLTDGQLSLSIDPLKETKSKSLKETLEVTVFDAAGGKRAYEMYSGGERLRIDFALRVALSRLLANRAGARLETLVIDEGFGSQDAEGRMRLLEAVMRVRSEFRTVLVITHIDELKEHFPVRIEVRKDPRTGSAVTVV